MTLFDAAASLPTAAREGVPGQTWWARAYCGPAHGRTWALAAGGPIAEHVDVSVDGHTHSYRLVQDLRARRPARDDFGHWMYLPASPAAGRHPTMATATPHRASGPPRRRRTFRPATTEQLPRREVP